MSDELFVPVDDNEPTLFVPVEEDVPVQKTQGLSSFPAMSGAALPTFGAQILQPTQPEELFIPVDEGAEEFLPATNVGPALSPTQKPLRDSDVYKVWQAAQTPLKQETVNTAPMGLGYVPSTITEKRGEAASVHMFVDSENFIVRNLPFPEQTASFFGNFLNLVFRSYGNVVELVGDVESKLGSLAKDKVFEDLVKYNKSLTAVKGWQDQMIADGEQIKAVGSDVAKTGLEIANAMRQRQGSDLSGWAGQFVGGLATWVPGIGASNAVLRNLGMFKGLSSYIASRSGPLAAHMFEQGTAAYMTGFATSEPGQRREAAAESALAFVGGAAPAGIKAEVLRRLVSGGMQALLPAMEGDLLSAAVLGVMGVFGESQWIPKEVKEQQAFALNKVQEYVDQMNLTTPRLPNHTRLFKTARGWWTTEPAFADDAVGVTYVDVPKGKLAEQQRVGQVEVPTGAAPQSSAKEYRLTSDLLSGATNVNGARIKRVHVATRAAELSKPGQELREQLLDAKKTAGAKLTQQQATYAAAMVDAMAQVAVERAGDVYSNEYRAPAWKPKYNEKGERVGNEWVPYNIADYYAENMAWITSLGVSSESGRVLAQAEALSSKSNPTPEQMKIAAVEKARTNGGLGIPAVRFADGTVLFDTRADAHAWYMRNDAKASDAALDGVLEHGYISPDTGMFISRSQATSKFAPVQKEKVPEWQREFQQDSQVTKGSILFSNAGESIIRLGPQADVSTVLHEFGHWFAELEHNRGNVLLDKWLGAGSGDTLSTSQHETFARALESWYRNGIAPRPELQALFNKFAPWMTKVYPRIQGTELEGKLPDSFFPLMERMFEYAEPIIPPSRITPRDAHHVALDIQQAFRTNVFQPAAEVKVIKLFTETLRKNNTAEQLENYSAARESIVNLRTGEKPVLTPQEHAEAQKAWKKLDALRENANREWADILHTDEDYINFVPNYIPHFYKIGDRKAREFVDKWIKNTPNAKHRKFEHLLVAAQEAGLEPVTQNIADLIDMWSEVNFKAIANKRLAEQMKAMRDELGGKVFLPAHKAPADWVKVKSPLLKSVVGKRDVGNRELPIYGDYKMDPRFEGLVNGFFVEPFRSNLSKAVTAVSSRYKAIKFSMSLFHPNVLMGATLYSNWKWYNPLAGLFNIKKGDKLSPIAQGLQYLKNEEFVRDFYGHGGVAETVISDAPTNILEKDAALISRQMRRIPLIGEVAALPSEAARLFLRGYNTVLWNRIHPGMKAYTYHNAVAMLMEHASTQALTSDQIRQVKQTIATQVNNIFGGQSWETHFATNKKAMQALHWLFAAPDWGKSNLALAMNFALANSPVPIDGMVNQLADRIPTLRGRLPEYNLLQNPAVRTLINKYWFGEMVGLTLLSLLGNKTMGGRWPWENEPDEKANIDITLLMRAVGTELPWMQMQQGGPIDMQRHYYVRHGKRVKEVANLFVEMSKVVGNKLNFPIQDLQNIIWGYKFGSDFPADWRQNELEGLEKWGSIFSEEFKQIRPLSLSDNNFALTFPLGRGISTFRATRDKTEIIKAYIDPGLFHREMGPLEFQSLAEQLDKACAENGLDPLDSWKSAYARAQKWIEWRALDAIQNKDEDEINKLLTIAPKLGMTSEQFLNAIKTRAKRNTEFRQRVAGPQDQEQELFVPVD